MQTSTAGLILLNRHISQLFEQIGLTEQKEFVSTEAQHRAVWALYFLATGKMEATEEELVLEKVVCGVPVNESVLTANHTFFEEEIVEMKDMLDAAIAHWPAIGSTSVDGLRESFIVREGSIQEHEERWELVVERKAYDILLDRYPFEFTMCRLQWMEKLLVTTWGI